MQLAKMSWPDVDGLDRATPFVFPIAALEQHGRHMPLFTDSLLLGEVIRRVQNFPIAERVVIAPLQWLGNSHHHLDMPGTLSASPRNYLALLHDLVYALARHGFRRFVLVNGHGGNKGPAEQALFEIRQDMRDHRDLLLSTITYWDAATPNHEECHLVQDEMGHAGEWETSMMLALRPDLVNHAFRNVPNLPFGDGAEPGYRGWTMLDRSHDGHIGDPAAATPEKGEYLFTLFGQGIAEYLQRVASWDGHDWSL